MRLLFVIPHYFGSDAEAETKRKHASITASADSRAAALRKTVMSLHQTFGTSQAMIQVGERRTIPANDPLRHEVHVVIATIGNANVVQQAQIPAKLAFHLSFDGDPLYLGFHCHDILRDRWGNFDYYSYLEDDLSIADAWLFEKLRWFNSCVGDEKLLLPNRFERSEDLAYKKCYLDGDLAEKVTRPFQDVNETPVLRSSVLGRPVQFCRPLNPHAGCFFLNAVQMQRWIAEPHFGQRSGDFVGPLESAATLGIMKTFAIYKPRARTCQLPGNRARRLPVHPADPQLRSCPSVAKMDAEN